MTYLGIDPGPISGSLAWINSQATVCYTKRFMDITEKELSNQIEEIHAMSKNCVCVIEKVWAFPKQGVTSAFGFGDNYGLIRGLMIAHNIPFKLVTPRTWQQFYGMKKKPKETKTQWKKRLKGRAQELFPTADICTETADAILIAAYCRKNY